MPLQLISRRDLDASVDAVIELTDRLLPAMRDEHILLPASEASAVPTLLVYAPLPEEPRSTTALNLYLKLFTMAELCGLQTVAVPLPEVYTPSDPRRVFFKAVEAASTLPEQSCVQHILVIVDDEQLELLAMRPRACTIGYDELPTKAEIFAPAEPDLTLADEDPVYRYDPDSHELHTEVSFGIMLDRIMDEKHMNPGEFVRRANISRQTLSKLRSGDTVPEKYTALACAVALRLSIWETKQLLQYAGYCLSQSIKMDVIVAYFICRQCYDVNEINIALYKEGIRQIGSRR